MLRVTGSSEQEYGGSRPALGQTFFMLANVEWKLKKTRVFCHCGFSLSPLECLARKRRFARAGDNRRVFRDCATCRRFFSKNFIHTILVFWGISVMKDNFLVGAFLKKRVDYSHGFSSVFFFRYT